MVVHLIPVGRGRYELYAEPAEPEAGPVAHDAGRVRRWLHATGDEWRKYVDAARMGEATGRFAKWRDAVICKLAASLDEQRTLRALRTADAVTVLYPSSLNDAAARASLDAILAAARRHHGQRLAIYLVLFILSGVFFFVPGPNVIAYYLGFQGFGHLQCWRGARHASTDVRWTLTPNDDLRELAVLAAQAHHARAERVRAIAQRLALEHLPAFFERAAA